MSKLIHLFVVSALTINVLCLTSCSENENPIPDPTNENSAVDAYFEGTPSYVKNPVSAVSVAFAKDFPTAVNPSWDVSNSVYRVRFSEIKSPVRATQAAGDAINRQAWYSENGQRLQYKDDDILVSDLPQAVRDTISQRYPDYVIEDVEVIRRGEEMFFEIEMERRNGHDDDIEFYINPDGTFRDGNAGGTGGNTNPESLQTAKQHFKAHFPNANDVEWETFKDFYHVEFDWHGGECSDDDDWDAFYDKSSGSIQMTKQEISERCLPAVIKTAITTKYGNRYEIDDIKMVTKGAGITYEVSIERDDNGHNDDLLIVYAADGTWISKTARPDYDHDD